MLFVDPPVVRDAQDTGLMEDYTVQERQGSCQDNSTVGDGLDDFTAAMWLV